MEKFRTCPICLEVPEQDIFQCRVGHVICNLCIVKVNGGLCPQCRVPFGTARIRNRLFEEMLDSQEFDCKFQERGCAHVCKREEITAHSNSCLYNPDTISVCEQLGLDNCKFRLGCISRAEVISHFEQVHNCPFKLSPDLTMSFEGKTLMNIVSRKTKSEAQKVANPSFLFAIASQELTLISPLFLIFGKMKQSTGYVSFYCIKAWEPPSRPSRNFNAIYSLVKEPATPSSSSTASSSTATSSSSALPTNKYNPFPFCGSMRVGGIKDVQTLLKASTINFPISLLEDHQFGTNKDYLQAKVTPLPAVANIPGVLSGSGPLRGSLILSLSSTPSIAP